MSVTVPLNTIGKHV